MATRAAPQRPPLLRWPTPFTMNDQGLPEPQSGASDIPDTQSTSTTDFGAGLGSSPAGGGASPAPAPKEAKARKDASAADDGEKPKPRRRRSGGAGRASSGAKASDGASDGAPEGAPDSSEPRSDADGDEKPARTRRRTRSRKPAEADEASSGASEEGDSPQDEGEQRPRRQRTRRKAGAGKSSGADGEAAEAAAVEASSEADGADRDPEGEADGEGAPRKRRRRRGGRGRRRRRSDDEGSEGEEASSEDSAEDGSRETSGGANADGSQDGEDSSADEGEAGGKRRRRRRGGRGRSKRKTSGDGDEESADGAEDAAGDDAKDPADAKPARKKRKRSRRKKSGSADEDDEPEEELSDEERAAKAEAQRVMRILVNAVDPEERRVAVVAEDDRISDLLMTAESQKTLVNDIYRGKVVNLEPAIGAAFIDFGQGRNGFLHTSDVMPIYGEEGFKLDQLLTANLDPEDWSDDDHHDVEEDDEPAPDEASEPEEGDDGAATEGDAEEDPEEDAGEHAGDPDEDGDASDAAEGTADADEGEQEDSEAGDGDGDSGEDDGKASGRGRRSRSRKAASTKKAAVRKESARRDVRRRSRKKVPISDLLKVGDQVVVQVTKDAIGDKGPTLTTYISIPGRYLVLMPSMARTGVSKKIPDDKERRRLKRVLQGMNCPDGMGVIVRTAGVGRRKMDLQRDLDYLMGVWDSFGKRLRQGRGPAPLYQESDLAIRTLRDLFDERTKTVVVDDVMVHEQMLEFAEQLMPDQKHRIVMHEGDRPVFHHFGMEQDFERIFARKLDLPSGGSLVFDQAEALVAIDINSGRTRTDSHDFEKIALKTNLEAVPEIARQIRLRDLGGIVVIDFIDMSRSSSNRQVEKALRTEMAKDRARSKLGRIGQFGLLEMTRQRLGPGTHKKVFQACPRCRGTARVRTVESRAQAILRRLGSAVTQKGFSTVEVKAHPEVVEYLEDRLSDWIRAIEHRSERKIEFTSVPDQVEDSVLRYLRADGREVRPGGRRKR